MGKITIVALLASIGAAAQTPKTAALEGLDPVLLTEGQESAGRDSIVLEYGHFRYQFSTEETRDRFRKDPQRYSIQLDGACARMGAPAVGSADAYFVYDHRIYVFGSSDCYKRFTANPKKYLEAEHPKPAWDPTAETRAQGKELLERTVAALGGAENWDKVASYTETRHAGSSLHRVSAKLPDSLITETTAGTNTFGSVATPQAVLTFFQGTGQPLPESFGRAILANMQSDLLPLLAGRKAAAFDSYFAGRAGNLERLQVNDHGRISTLLRDPESGRISAVEWQGPSPGGYVVYHVAYADYRAAGGLLLPFRADVSAEGSDEPLPPSRSWTVESYELNPADIDARLHPQVKIAGQ